MLANSNIHGGAPETLVFLHHFGGSSRSWREVIARLPDFRCFAPDVRGFGDAPDVPEAWSVDASADNIAARIEAAGIESYTLVGHSMGGKIALGLAARQPVGLQRLVLVAPSPPMPEPLKNEERERLLNGFGKRASAPCSGFLPQCPHSAGAIRRWKRDRPHHRMGLAPLQNALSLVADGMAPLRYSGPHQ